MYLNFYCFGLKLQFSLQTFMKILSTNMSKNSKSTNTGIMKQFLLYSAALTQGRLFTRHATTIRTD